MYKNYQFGDLNSAYIMGLYEDYLNDPDSVGLDLVDFFESEEFKNILSNLNAEKNTSNKENPHQFIGRTNQTTSRRSASLSKGSQGQLS